MQAKLIRTDGPNLEAAVEIEGQGYCVMDLISLDVRDAPKLDELFQFEFSNMIDENES